MSQKVIVPVEFNLDPIVQIENGETINFPMTVKADVTIDVAMMVQSINLKEIIELPTGSS